MTPTKKLQRRRQNGRTAGRTRRRERVRPTQQWQWQWGTGKVKASEKPPPPSAVHAVTEGGREGRGTEEVFLPVPVVVGEKGLLGMLDADFVSWYY